MGWIERRCGSAIAMDSQNAFHLNTEGGTGTGLHSTMRIDEPIQRSRVSNGSGEETLYGK